MEAQAVLASDFWRVNSYGYPNPFNADVKSQEAWVTLLSFINNDEGSYSSLKRYWSSCEAPRKLESHAVESWKATFEEFGILYVISRSDKITVTPAGHQICEAVEANDEQRFLWIGLNLLFRYPLRGPPRGRGKSDAHDSSDVLPYRFLYSAMRDLGDYFWWTELERILCRVFSTTAMRPAIDFVRQLRGSPSDLETIPLPVDKRKGAFYNSLNQVANHAGLNHSVLNQDNLSEYYGPQESRRRHSIRKECMGLVSAALGDIGMPGECNSSASYVDRVPAAPGFSSEEEYFRYLGASVPALAETAAGEAPQIVSIGGDTVFILASDVHFKTISTTTSQTCIEGESFKLCRIARNCRVILSTDEKWTYVVLGKELSGSNTVRLTIRRARPITNLEPIQRLLGETDA